jgi:membrane associated rhomboid family serine protease
MDRLVPDGQIPVALFVMLITLGASVAAFYNRQFMFESMLYPYEVSRGRKLQGLVTSGFIHADFPHLLFNMMSYYFFAFPLQHRIGADRFMIIYLGSLIIANMVTTISNRNDSSYLSLGASGAVSGIIFSMILFAPMTKFYIFILPIGVPAFIYGLIYLGFSYYASTQRYDNINHIAHLWGAIAGIILTVTLVPDAIESFIAGFQ